MKIFSLKRRPVLPVILVVIALLLAAACGQGGTSTPSGSGGSTGSSGGGGETGAGAGSQDLPDKIKIGAALALTGPTATIGNLMKNGAELAVKQINEAGGVRGIQLELISEDSQGETKTAVTAYQKLVEVEKVAAMLTMQTGPTLAAVPLAEEFGVVVMNGGGQSDVLANASPYLYNVLPVIRYEVKVLAEYLANEVGAETAAILYLNDDSGTSAEANFTQFFEAAGGKVVAKETHEYGQTDYRAALSKILAEDPDVVYLTAYGRDVVIAIEQMRSLGYDGLIADTAWVQTPELYQTEASEGLIHTALVYRPDDDFITAFQEQYGTDPSLYTANYYDAVTIMAEALDYAIEKGYGTDGNAIKRAIDEIGEFQVLSGTLKFLDDNTAMRDIDIAVVRDGKSEVIATVEAQ